MKIHCKKHGVHFPDEKETIYQCPFWKEWGLNKLPKHYKSMIWVWMFALPIDEIAIKTKIAIETHIRGIQIKEEVNQFANHVKNYESWNDDKRKKFQAEYFMWTEKLSKDKDYYAKVLLTAFQKEKKK